MFHIHSGRHEHAHLNVCFFLSSYLSHHISTTIYVNVQLAQ